MAVIQIHLRIIYLQTTKIILVNQIPVNGQNVITLPLRRQIIVPRIDGRSLISNKKLIFRVFKINCIINKYIN